jgi:hypothetical protein
MPAIITMRLPPPRLASSENFAIFAPCPTRAVFGPEKRAVRLVFPGSIAGYAQTVAKAIRISGHRSDIELATRIQEVALWKPSEDAALDGFPKRWVH